MKNSHPYLEKFSREIEIEKIKSLKNSLEQQLTLEKFFIFRKSLELVKGITSSKQILNGPVVTLGDKKELSQEQKKDLIDSLKAFIPWKKGPFCIFGELIDAEWRSDLKWERIRPHISGLKQKIVADIGCHNGYFMYRMAAENPELVIGFEPYPKHLFNFQLLQQLSPCSNLAFELLGVEHIDLYPQFFDTVFCLGILYHHTDPVGLLRKIYQSLKPQGELIIDCQGIPGEDDIALFPAGRYAQARGIWFLPSLKCLNNWLVRTRFRKIECFYKSPLSTEEQRTTPWAPIDSLEDFLDPHDKTKTKEGYPAPWRFYVKAVR